MLDFLFVISNFFSLSYDWDVISTGRNLSKSVFECKFQMERGVAHQPLEVGNSAESKFDSIRQNFDSIRLIIVASLGDRVVNFPEI